MNKKIIIFSLLLMCLSLCSCFERIEIEIPVGEKIKNDFSVNEYFRDNAVIQADEEINITGISEEGVVLVASLFDNRGNLINQNYGITEGNNSFSIIIKTPKASTKVYKLEIKDSNNTFVHNYQNIKFGKVWMINKNDYPIIETFNNKKESENYDNFGFYYVTENEKEWLDKNIENIVNPFILSFVKTVEKENQSLLSDGVPVGIIILDIQSDNIYEWISKNYVERIKYIKEYFEFFDIDEEDNVSKLYETVLKSLEGIKLEGIIWNFSLKEANNAVIYNEKYFNVYAAMLNILTNHFCDVYSEKVKIIFIQSESSDNNLVDRLRAEQIRNSYYFNNTILIPTYDLNVEYNKELEKNEIVELDSEKLLSRIINVLYNDYLVSGYSKLITKSNDDGVMTNITIVISNTDDLKYEVTEEMEMINFLEIYDENNNLLNIEYKVVNNQIIIDLLKPVTDEEIDILEEEKELINEYYQVSKIKYSVKNSENNGWLYNEYLIPVLPFVIEVGR